MIEKSAKEDHRILNILLEEIKAKQNLNTARGLCAYRCESRELASCVEDYERIMTDLSRELHVLEKKVERHRAEIIGERLKSDDHETQVSAFEEMVQNTIHDFTNRIREEFATQINEIRKEVNFHIAKGD